MLTWRTTTRSASASADANSMSTCFSDRERVCASERPSQSIRRDGLRWTVNDCLTAPMLVGAGGHFCPVARMLNGSSEGAALVVAQEAEFAIDPRDVSSFTTVPERPELYFSRALNGYGWCLRKENYLNIGFGHLDRRRLPSATAEFAAFLKTEGRIPAHVSCRWKGHAYVLSGSPRRRVDDGVLLVGDAAGLAYPQSGEGIRPAIESGLIAASTIIEAHGQYTRAAARTVRGPAARTIRYQPRAFALLVRGLALPTWTNLGSLADPHAVVRSAGVAQSVVSARARTGSHACMKVGFTHGPARRAECSDVP